ncbi:alkaline shock response membrane anchor protein AmaP [Amycolatopsis sp. FBCC-B4732]|uniref:alkaline shock response membrane anchor protein AmaP n=1 Tax=Amycolatopsis sp. FBCC-B4732 TaxID=3079339 RepID=UPI001FF40DFB|nr:alkaline shock response membrane anchor protein AmaP [Amycolatopsis sp. FBCC-B4732]UOX87442.1 alkaline shock response membrane anchor protein AmaP [Amycolatopsis sp. FBCC-B4732]
MNRPAALNRTLLALIGLVLLAAGGFAVATYFGRLHLLDPAAPLVPGAAPPPTWVFWVAIGVAVLLGLLCLRWLAAQAFRRPKSVAWRSETETGALVLDSGTAAGPVAADVEEYDGVRAASAWLSGPRDAPELALVVTTDRDADATAIRERITDHAVPRLKQALEVEDLPVRLEIRLTAKSGARAR